MRIKHNYITYHIILYVGGELQVTIGSPIKYKYYQLLRVN